MAIIGIDLGGTKVAAARFSADGEIIGRIDRKLEGRTGREVGSLLCSMAGELVSGGSGPTSVGICVPGIAWVNTGSVWAPNIPGWEDYPLRDEIAEALKLAKNDVLLDSDRSCAILGEVWKGAAKGCRNAVFLAVGTGIGAGILVEGRVLRGASGIAGAIGWLALDRPFESKYAGVGCFEYHASGEGLVRVARALRDAGSPVEASGTPGDRLTAAGILEAADQDDTAARKVLDCAIGYWGMAVANLVSLFNPEKIIFGGGVFGPALRYLPEIREEAKKWGQPIAMQQVALEGSRLERDAVLYGAGYLAIKKGEKDQV
jgi:glucokinase